MPVADRGNVAKDSNLQANGGRTNHLKDNLKIWDSNLQADGGWTNHLKDNLRIFLFQNCLSLLCFERVKFLRLITQVKLTCDNLGLM